MDQPVVINTVGDGKGGDPADLLDAVLAAVLAEIAGVGPLAASGPTVFDCGGGSGRRAVPLARHGATVTVIDSSVDALAILARRAAEAGVGERVNGIQADVETLGDLIPAASVDLLLLHEVLDSRAEAAAAVSAAALALRPGGYLSVVVPNTVAAVLARALGGDLHGALAEVELSSPAGPAPLDLSALADLATTAGLEVVARRGIGVFTSLVPGSVLDGRPGSRALLDRLDHVGSGLSPYREIAGHLHLLARRRPD